MAVSEYREYSISEKNAKTHTSIIHSNMVQASPFILEPVTMKEVRLENVRLSDDVRNREAWRYPCTAFVPTLA